MLKNVGRSEDINMEILRIVLGIQLLAGLIYFIIIIRYRHLYEGKIDRGIVIDAVLESFLRAAGTTFSITTLYFAFSSFIPFILFGEPALASVEIYLYTAAAIGAIIVFVYVFHPYLEKIRIKKS